MLLVAVLGLLVPVGQARSQAEPTESPLHRALAAVRASVPPELLAEVADYLPRTDEEATPRPLTSLPLAQQSLVLHSACTQASNDVVVFTCEDELAYIDGLQTPIELVHQLVEAANAVARGSNPVEATVAYLGVGELASEEAIDTVVASAVPPEPDDVDEDDLRQVDLYPVGVEVILPDGRMLLPNPIGLAKRYRCGWFARPYPGRAATAVRTGWLAPSSTQAGADANARAWAHSQGFHDTPGFAGGGMTRPQTYAGCGLGTYRDHAWPDITQLRIGSAPPYTWQARLLVQDYTSAPYGEPNPEVWRSGPWPYAEWPVYVNWWHRTR